jgi:hypothetical protein
MELWSRDPNVWLEMVDKYYTRLTLIKLPRVVNRFVRLAPVYVRPSFSQELNVYMGEAAQCYY